MFDPFGRIAFIICVLLAIKFIGRVSKNKKLNNALRKIQVLQITQNSYGFTDSNSHPTRSDSRGIIKMIGF